MKFLEKDLEEIILKTDNEILNKKGLDISGNKLTQLRVGNYGICDIITWSRDHTILNITIYELKKDKIGISALLQAVGYEKGLNRYLKKRFKNKDIYFNTNIVLIGSKLDVSGNFCFLADFLRISMVTYKYNHDGISFKKEMNYSLTNEGF